MRVLVLGGGGQVASAVVAAAPAQHHVVARSRAELDIGDAKAVARALTETSAEWVVNAAAYTAVDLAEDQPAQAMAVNDTAVGVLAAAASAAGCRLLHLSTDFVFDGKSNRAYLPDDQTNPLSVYGVSKLGGERRVLNDAGSGVVLRTAWVYAGAGRNFVLTMLRLMREKEQVSVVCDQIGAPTWAAGIAAAHGIEMSSHLLPEISAHLLAASPTCHYLEYVDWADAILEEPLQIQDGLARVPDRPGIGLTWRSEAVKALSLER